MKITSKRKAAQIVSQEPKFKKQKSDSKDEQLKELREENEQIQAAADRNSVKLLTTTCTNENQFRQRKTRSRQVATKVY